MLKADKLRIIGDDAVREIDLGKGPDSMKVTILDNGAFRCEVKGSISSVNHGNADTFLGNISRALGGVVKILKNGHGHHGHTHTHGGTTHSH